MSPHKKDIVQIIKEEERDDARFTLIKLKTPSGFLSGKWWGPKNVRPILCLHGWMDNCGSFDKLVPLLPQEHSYLAFDLPGHGLSSRYPPGMIYSYYDIIVLIERIRREYQWNKISLLAHSFGGLCCFFYAALYPDNVDLAVVFDGFEPFMPDRVYWTRWTMTQHLKMQDRKHESEPPAYDYEELVDRLLKGSNKSLDWESAKVLLKRNIKRSSKYPKKYYLTHDRGIIGFDRVTRSLEDLLDYAPHITCPLLSCRGEDSWLIGANFRETAPVRELLRANNPNYRDVMGPGNHHFHLTHPEAYAGEITEFIRKHRSIKGKL